MSLGTYNVVLEGRTLAGQSASEVSSRLATLFKTSNERVAPLLLGKPIVIRRGLDEQTAQRYQIAIEGAGAACRIEVDTIDVELPPPTLAPAGAVDSPPNESSGQSRAAEHAFAPENVVTRTPKQGEPTTAQSVSDAMKLVVENLDVIRQKIGRSHAYLGILGGFCAYGFSLFLPWAHIPTGMLARDGGSTNGWKEMAFFAIIPLVFALYPVFIRKSVSIGNVLVNIVIAFALLGYNNVINRTSWFGGYGTVDMGSELGVGFWIGLASIFTVSLCGIAWALHTSHQGEAATA